MLKLQCPGCAYVIRTTRTWLDVGLPVCCCGEDFEVASLVCDNAPATVATVPAKSLSSSKSQARITIHP